MKNLILSTSLLLCFSQVSFSQTANINYQLYWDANNNCQFDTGELLVYGLPWGSQLGMQYVNSSSGLSTANTGSIGCSAGPIIVNNYQLPATNTLSLPGSPNYPGIVAGQGCSAYTNVPYGASSPVYLPLSSANGLSNVIFGAGNINYSGSATGNTFPVCSTLGNDSVSFSLSYWNLFTCSSPGMSTRSFSLSFDGVQYDLLTTTGLPYVNNMVSGSNNMSILSESYSNDMSTLYFKTRLPAGISVQGSHTVAIVSSQLYNNPLSVLNYSCIINSSPCAKIKGKFFADCNNNCIQDPGEAGLGSGVEGKVYNASGFNVTFQPGSNGDFSIFLPSAAAYSLTQYSVTPGFTPCVTNTVTIPPSSGTSTFQFGYNVVSTASGDYAVYIWTNGQSNPSNTFTAHIYTNPQSFTSNCLGTLPANPGTLKFKIATLTTYAGMAYGPAPSNIVPSPTGDTLVWTVANLNQNTTRGVKLTISPTVSLQTNFSVVATINPSYDSNPVNNVYVRGNTVGAPFDPNDKHLSAKGLQDNGDVIYSNMQEFQYNINFQNIGSAPAINVKTIDTMDVNLDFSSLKVIASSFPVSVQKDHNSREVIFLFEGIYLPGAYNEPASHGYVRYSIKLKNGLMPNTVIKNRAHNVFDYNEPVATNQTINKLITGTGIAEGGMMNRTIRVMPNPVKDKLNLQSEEKISNVKIYNVQGTLIRDIKADAPNVEIDMNDLSPAVYFLNISLQNGQGSTAKIIKN